MEQPAPIGSGRVSRRRDRRVREILAAADVLAERGYQGFVLDEVAEQVDFTKASLYHYFSSRDELVGSCLEYLGDIMIEQLRAEVAARPGGAAEQLRRLVVAQLELTTWSHQETARLFLQPVELPPGPRPGAARPSRQLFRMVVRRGVANGEFTGPGVDGAGGQTEDVALHNRYGAVNHVPVWWRRDFDRMAESVAQSVLQLLRAPA